MRERESDDDHYRMNQKRNAEKSLGAGDWMGLSGCPSLSARNNGSPWPRAPRLHRSWPLIGQSPRSLASDWPGRSHRRPWPHWWWENAAGCQSLTRGLPQGDRGSESSWWPIRGQCPGHVITPSQWETKSAEGSEEHNKWSQKIKTNPIQYRQ